MSQTFIKKGWIPHQSTRDALKKRFFSERQYKANYKIFMERYEGQHVNNASSTFLAFFDKMHGELTPKPDLSKEKEQDLKRQQDIENKPENAVERAEETKTTMTALTREQALEWLTSQGRCFSGR